MDWFISQLDGSFIDAVTGIVFGAVPVGVLMPVVFFLVGYLIKRAFGWLSRG